MRVSVGSDHRGVQMRHDLVELLRRLGHEPVDEGTDETKNVDYPDIAALVARRVAGGAADRGILICGTGIGMAIAANKISGIRAASCNDELTAELSRRHNNANVLCLSGDLLGPRNLQKLVQLWLDTDFEGGRHARRVGKIAQLECSDPSAAAAPADSSSPGSSSQANRAETT